MNNTFIKRTFLYTVYITKPNRNSTYAHIVAAQTKSKQQNPWLAAGPIPTLTYELEKQTVHLALLLLALSI